MGFFHTQKGADGIMRRQTCVYEYQFILRIIYFMVVFYLKNFIYFTFAISAFAVVCL